MAPNPVDDCIVNCGMPSTGITLSIVGLGGITFNILPFASNILS